MLETIKDLIGWSDKTALKYNNPEHSLATESMVHITSQPPNSTGPNKESADAIKPPEQAVTTVHDTGPHVERVGTPQPSVTPASQSAANGRRNTSSTLPLNSLDPARKRRHRDTEEQLRSTVGAKESENNHLLETIRRIRGERDNAINDNRSFQITVKGLRGDKETLSNQLQGLKKDSDAKEHAAKKRIAELEAINKRKDDELRIVQAKLRGTEEKQLQMAQLLEARTADLNGVQPFLTTADSYSGVDIITMTESLNAEIFQTAAHMAELVEDESMVATSEQRAHNVQKYQKLLDSARREMGELLWTHCEKNYNEMRADPLPLQLAMQYLLSKWCAYNVRCFRGGQFGGLLDELYKRIRESEVQPIAGRWRAITSANMPPSSAENMSTDVMNLLLSLLIFCGWLPNSVQWQKSTASCKQMVLTIEKMAAQLTKATKEGITTADMEVFVVPSDASFQGDMEDIYAEEVGKGIISSERDRGRVLCTVGLGVRRALLKRSEGKTFEAAEVLLKPKVALTSVLMNDQGRDNRNSMVLQSWTDGKDRESY